jgi:hypothetical protein
VRDLVPVDVDHVRTAHASVKSERRSSSAPTLGISAAIGESRLPRTRERAAMTAKIVVS